MRLLLIVIASIALFSCGNASAPKVIPGAGGGHLYELMEEDSTEQQTDTTAKTK
jgi:hypothetical protein